MTALPKVADTGLIRWTNAETLAVARRYFALRDTSGMTMAQAAEAAQHCLPVERHRSFKNNVSKSVARLTALYEAWAPEHPEETSQDREAARRGFEENPTLPDGPILEEPEGDLLPVFELPRLPPAPSVAPPAPAAMAPLEAALAGMVVNAVGAHVGQLTDAMREEMQRMRDEFQSLLAQQYDALMCYWDPKYKERHELTAEYVPDPSVKLGVLHEVRVRQRRVLIVNGGKGDQFHNVRVHFKGVHFEFADAANTKLLGNGTFYDLVVTTAFVSHKAVNILKNLHGNRLIQGDIRGMGTLVATVKKYLDL